MSARDRPSSRSRSGRFLDRILAARRRRLLGIYVFAILVAVVAFTVAYRFGQPAFENEPTTWTGAFAVVVQSLTTTGYGGDAPWTSAPMHLLTIAMQATGVLFLFTALPVIALPLIREALETRPPSSIPPTEDHVVICSYGAHTETLIDELDGRGVSYVVVEPDRELAAELYVDGYDVVEADPESTTDLADVHVGEARAVAVEATEEVGASVILTVRDLAPEVPVVSVVEDADRAAYHRYAGADRVFSPRESVGERLARKATTTVTSELDEAVEVGEDLEIAELAVHSGSELVGVRLGESDIRERTGANVVGAWIAGEFHAPPIEEPLDEHSVLLVAGSDPQLEALNDITLSRTRSHDRGTVVVAGAGDTGSAATEVLREAGVEYTVLDVADGPNVDLVGDATDPETLRAAGVREAGSLLLTLDDDAEAVFATLVARDLAPETEIIARADDADSVRKLYRAGADYVLSLGRVTGRLQAAALLDEELLAIDTQVKVVRTDAGHLAGETIAGANVRRRTGATIVAVERDGDVVTSPPPEFRIEDGDEVVVVGTDEGIARFRDL